MVLVGQRRSSYRDWTVRGMKQLLRLADETWLMKPG